MNSQSRITPDRAVLVGALLAALAYIQDIRYDFILDDYPLILMNTSIAHWRNWKMAFINHIFATDEPTLPAEITFMHYRPVYKLWHMLHAHVFGYVFPWWHLTSLLLHFGVTILVYLLGIRVVKERWTAALAALLFAFHPIHVESVAYVSASSDLLLAFFALIAFLAYRQFREDGASLFYFGVSVVAAALAMMSKETAAMFPWMLVAYEAMRETPLGTRESWKRFVWTLPFFVVVAAYAGVRTMLFGAQLAKGGAVTHMASLLDIPLVLIVYLHNLFWPFRLSFFYPADWGSQWTLWKGATGILVMLAAIFSWIRFRDRQGLRLQLLWAAILFVPAVLAITSFAQDDWIHDRQMYLVSVPVCLIAAAFLTDPKLPAKASLILSSIVLAILLIDLAIQVPRFSDNASIYASAMELDPQSAIMHGYYGEALWMYGRREEGLREFKICTELSPNSSGTHERYGAALAQIGRDDDAALEYGKALQLATRPTPFRAFILYELAGFELKHSNFSNAEGHLRESLQISPQSMSGHDLLARALRELGRTKEADAENQFAAGLRQQFVQQHRGSTE